MCHFDTIELLLENGAAIETENDRGESSIDVVAGEWNEGLAGFYSGIAVAVGMEIDLDRIEQDRPRVKKLLEDHLAGSDD